VFLINFLAAILAAQLFRGSLPAQDDSGNTIRVQFFSLWNSFLGMYQVFSSENWTTIMYSLTNFNNFYNTAWIAAIFMILWFMLANFITLNMFIAIIQENFDISEDKKRLKQIENYIEQRELGLTSAHGNMSIANMIRQGIAAAGGRRQGPSRNGATDLLLKEAIITEFLHQKDGDMDNDVPGVIHPNRADTQFNFDRPMRPPAGLVRSGTLSSIWTTFVGKFQSQDPNPFYTRINISRINDEDSNSSSNSDAIARARNLVKQQKDREKSQRAYLAKHPNYNVSLYMFKPQNIIRHWSQMIVGPGRGGERIEGVQPTGVAWYAFSAFIYACVVAMVLIACITTPLYQKQYFERHETRLTLRNWLTFSDVGFAVVFTIEAIIKVIADGFFWTPHAYYRSTWGFIDGIVLITLWISVIGAFINDADISRSVGALKALRALRLLNISDHARENFHAVIVRGAPKIIGAAFVSLSLLLPFAIYGLNLFLGKLISCNDGNSNIDNLNDCWGEYATSTPFNWNVYAPRVAANSYYSFDNFGASLSILFQIVSQEGWIDVMFAAQSAVGRFRQPQPFSSPGNAVFFVIFNLLGSVFVLTLFVSVFMRNYTEMTGVAYLTMEQRSWLELRKRLDQIRPSKRSPNLDGLTKWKKKIYRMAVTKSGKQGTWYKFVTAVLVLHLVILCTEFDPAPKWWDDVRDGIFLFFTVIFGVNIFIRIVGLSWPRFRKSSWDIYSLASVTGTGISTILVLVQPNNAVFSRIQRLFLVSIAFLLIPRNNQLDQLFKTAAASLAMIMNLMATWFVLFLIFAIAMTQAFSLTRFGVQGTGNVNLRNVPKALLLLFRMSVGEGWNQIMEDYASAVEPFCNNGNGDALMSDCGSVSWARFLFIAWNILSMYLFVNLFISLIYESFSYVYQVSSGLRIITREELRRFKEAWAVVDPNGTGFIPRSSQSLARVLRELGGVFDMSIYPEEYGVRKLAEECAAVAPRPGSTIGPSGDQTQQNRISTWSVHNDMEYGFHPRVQDIDLDLLNAKMNELPIHEIRQRRMRLNLFWEEIMSRADRERGIGFTDLLLALTHYKVINDNKSLQLPEWLRRKQRLVLIEQEVRRQVVMRFFEAYQHRKRFRKHQERVRAGRIATVAAPKFEFAVPEIFVEDEDVARLEAEERTRQQEAERLRQQLSQDPQLRNGGQGPFSDSSRAVSGIPTPSGASSPRYSDGSIQVSPVPSPQLHAQFPLPPAGQGAARQPTQGRSPPHLTPQFLPTHMQQHQRSQSGDSGGHSPSTTGPAWRPSLDVHVPPLDLSSIHNSQVETSPRSRAGSAVSMQDVLEQLDASAWGESLRRSLSVGRSPSRGNERNEAGSPAGDRRET
jgi:voltage-dependent calcium channel